MRFANDYDIEQFLRLTDGGHTPNAFNAAVILNNLADWANGNSDGWAHWATPCRSAARLIDLLENLRRDYFRGGTLADLSAAEIRRACAPIKAFLTRQGVAHDEVFIGHLGEI